MLYLVTRTDKVDYDEYDSFVVRANSVQTAIVVCDNSQFTKDNTNVIELRTDGNTEIIIGSFNAG